MVEDSKTDGEARRTRARSLPPVRSYVANSETLVVDAWAHLHLRTLRQRQDATVFDAPRPNRGSWGHPTLCSRPCIYVAKQGRCQKGAACGFCHHHHNDPKPDKQQRHLISTMPRAELLSLLADLLRDRADQDGFHDVSFVVAVVAVQAGLRPSSFQTKYRKLSNLRQVLQRMNFSAILAMAAHHCEGRGKASILQELRVLRNSAR